MTPLLQLACSVALAALVGWLLQKWIALFDDLYTAGFFWLLIVFTYAFIYDRRQARLRREAIEDLLAAEREPETSRKPSAPN